MLAVRYEITMNGYQARKINGIRNIVFGQVLELVNTNFGLNAEESFP